MTMVKFVCVSVLMVVFGGYLEVQAQTPDLHCFNCTTQGEDVTCRDNPDKVTNGEVACENGWCEIIRQEHTEIPESIVTFYRGCSKTQPLFLNDIVSDAHLTTYYTTCRSNKCNSGNGLKTSTGGGGIGGGGLVGSIVVLGEESSAHLKHIYILLIPVSLCLSFSLHLY